MIMNLFQDKVGRPGGTRTPNGRFWRPVLYQLNYWPVRYGIYNLRINTVFHSYILKFHPITECRPYRLSL